MDQQGTAQANLAVKRVIERAEQYDRERPSQHTLIMGGSARERRSVLDLIEARLRHGMPGQPKQVGRPFSAFDKAPANAKGLWFETANAAGLPRENDNRDNGLVRIQQAAAKSLFVAVVDNLDHVLRNWKDAGEALNLRWALQNVNGLMVVASTEGPISTADRHEHTILGMTFTTQMIAPMAAVR